MSNKIKLGRGTKSRIETIKETLDNYEIVYATDTDEIGVKKPDGEVNYIGAGGGIEDAPADDKLYGRKNEEWSEIAIEPGGNIDTLTLANKLCWRGDCKLVTETELISRLKWRE